MLSKIEKEKGVVAIWIAAMMVALIGFGALVTDVGSLYEERRQLQTKADSAALAAARELAENNSVDVAISAARRFSDYNPSNNPSEQIFSVSPNLSLNNVTILIREKITKASKGLFLAPVLGVTQAEVKARAVAIWGNPGASGNLAPFTVYKDDLPPPGTPLPGPLITIYPRKESSPPGGFGVIDFDQSENSQAKFERWVRDGYDKYVWANRWIDQGPGLRASFQDAVEYRIMTDSVILVPVYDEYRGQGSNGEYHIIGFAAFNVTGVNLQTGNKTLSGYFISRTIPGPVNPQGQFFGVSAISLAE